MSGGGCSCEAPHDKIASASKLNQWMVVNYMPCCISVLMRKPLAPSPKASAAHTLMAWPIPQGLRAHALAPGPQGLRAHAPRCKEPGLGILAPKARGQGCRHPPKEERPRTHDCSSQGPEALRTSGPGSSGAWNPGVLDWVWIPVSGHGGAMK